MTNMYAFSEHWYKNSADLIHVIGQPEFPQQLLDTISTIMPFDQAVILSFERNLPPIEVGSCVIDDRRGTVVDNYLNGCYQLDPWYHAHLNSNLRDGCYFLHQFAPDNFYNSQYFHEYYRSLEIDNEVVFVVNLPSRQQIQISIGLFEKQLTNNLLEALNLATPLLIECTKQHWAQMTKTLPSEKERNIIVHQHIAYTLRNFGSDTLTDREREVALLIIRGYSLKSISEVLGTAFGTTKVHCKNLYKKLDINSQAELFAIFLDQVLAVPEVA